MLRNTYTYTQLIDMNSHEPLFNLASNKKANISELHQHRSTPKPCTAYALHCLSLVLYVYCIIGPMKCMVLKYERKERITELQLYNKTWQLFSSTSTNMATVPCESTVHYNIYTLLRACCLACLCISARRQCYQYPQLWTVYNENVHMSSQKQQINQTMAALPLQVQVVLTIKTAVHPPHTAGLQLKTMHIICTYKICNICVR